MELKFKNEEAKWSYLAAIIDTDGCTGITRSVCKGLSKSHRKNRVNFSTYIIVSNTNLEWIASLIETFGGGYHRIHRQYGMGNKPVADWKLRANRMRKIIPKIEPYLFIKKRQCELVKRALEILKDRTRSGIILPYSKELDKIWRECKILNQKGIK